MKRYIRWFCIAWTGLLIAPIGCAGPEPTNEPLEAIRLALKPIPNALVGGSFDWELKDSAGNTLGSGSHTFVGTDSSTAILNYSGPTRTNMTLTIKLFTPAGLPCNTVSQIVSSNAADVIMAIACPAETVKAAQEFSIAQTTTANNVAQFAGTYGEPVAPFTSVSYNSKADGTGNVLQITSGLIWSYNGTANGTYSYIKATGTIDFTSALNPNCTDSYNYSVLDGLDTWVKVLDLGLRQANINNDSGCAAQPLPNFGGRWYAKTVAN